MQTACRKYLFESPSKAGSHVNNRTLAPFNQLRKNGPLTRSLHPNSCPAVSEQIISKKKFHAPVSASSVYYSAVVACVNFISGLDLTALCHYSGGLHCWATCWILVPGKDLDHVKYLKDWREKKVGNGQQM